MRFVASTLTVALLLCSCSSSPSAETPEAKAPAVAKGFIFVSNPALKELMATKVEVLTETLWNASLEETAPKNDADWKKFEEAAKGLIEAGKSMLEPPLVKDQGKWKEETQKLLDLTDVALKAIREKNLAALNDTANKMTGDTCMSCHELYYTGPQN
jgi:cytochrome c556